MLLCQIVIQFIACSLLFSLSAYGQSGGLEPEQFAFSSSNKRRSSYRKADPDEPQLKIMASAQPVKPASQPPSMASQTPALEQQAPPIASNPPQQQQPMASQRPGSQQQLASIVSQPPQQQPLSMASRPVSQHRQSAMPQVSQRPQPHEIPEYLQSLYRGAPSKYEAAKPAIHEPMKPHLSKFEPFQPLEPCSAIVAELNQVPGQYARSMLLYTILASVDKTAHDEPGENIRSDKDAVGALEELYKMTIETGSYGHDDEGGVGFLPYIGRLIQCDADPETGRTLFQKMIEHGMTGALNTQLAGWLSHGTESYQPQLRLDKDGNTLMHLAVLSGSIPVLDLLLQQEARRYPTTGAVSLQKSSFWVLSALNHQNNISKKPLDLAPTPGFKKQLRKKFRNITNFLRKILQTQNLSSATMQDLSAAIGAADNQMNSA